MNDVDLKRRLVDAAARRYRPAGRFAYRFALGKLGGDPVFIALLARGLIPDGSRILDLGCGQGLLGAWLSAAAEQYASGPWCDEWPPPPVVSSFRGIDLGSRDVARANGALGTAAMVETGDIRTAMFGEADTIVILDVLHYMDVDDQQRTLEKVRATLAPKGVLLLRIGDASGGLPFRVSSWVDRIVLFARGRGWVQLYCRPLPEWIGVLDRLGFRTVAISMSSNTHFANVLLVARPQ